MKALTGYTANCLHIVKDFANNLKLKRFEKSCIDLKQKTEKMYTLTVKFQPQTLVQPMRYVKH